MTSRCFGGGMCPFCPPLDPGLKFIILAPECIVVVRKFFSDVHKLYRFISVIMYNNNDPCREKIC